MTWFFNPPPRNGPPVPLPNQSARRVAGRTAPPRVAAGRRRRKEARNVRTTYKLVSPRRRNRGRKRRNTATIGAHRSKGWQVSKTSGRMIPPGGWVSDRAKNRRRKAKRRKNRGSQI